MCFSYGTPGSVFLLLPVIFSLLFFPKCCLSFDAVSSKVVFQSSTLLSSAGLADPQVLKCFLLSFGKFCLPVRDAQKTSQVKSFRGGGEKKGLS